MASLVDISRFDSDAEALMVLFNAATAGGGSLKVPMSLEEASAELFRLPLLVLTLRGMTMNLLFDGTDTLDCTAYDKANMGPGYAQRVLDEYQQMKRSLSAAV